MVLHHQTAGPKGKVSFFSEGPKYISPFCWSDYSRLHSNVHLLRKSLQMRRFGQTVAFAIVWVKRDAAWPLRHVPWTLSQPNGCYFLAVPNENNFVSQQNASPVVLGSHWFVSCRNVPKSYGAFGYLLPNLSTQESCCGDEPLLD